MILSAFGLKDGKFFVPFGLRFGEKLRTDVLARYRRKAERDWEEMEIIRKNIDTGKKPRKKYRNSNCFVDTKLSYMFPLDCFSNLSLTVRA